MSTNTKVKAYKDSELLNRVKSLASFDKIPEDYWVLAVRSNEDDPGKYDDKIYIFKGEQFIMVMPGTTNSGSYYLRNPLNSKGTAIIKSNQWVYDMYKKTDGKTIRHHKGKMLALRQVKDCDYYRDNNKDSKVDEVGTIYRGNYSTNLHCNSYNKRSGLHTWLIGKFSAGCIVINHLTKYRAFLKLLKPTQSVSLCILKEF